MTESRVGLGTNTSTTQALPTAPVPGQQEAQELQQDQGRDTRTPGVVLPDGTVVPQQGETRTDTGRSAAVEGNRSVAAGTAAQRNEAARADLLAKAGVGRAGEVRDRVDVRAADTRTSQVLGAAAALPPPAPRSIEMSAETRQGAEAFATNFDRVGNDFVAMLQSMLGNDQQLASRPMLRDDLPLSDVVAYFMGAATTSNAQERAFDGTQGQTGSPFGSAASALTTGDGSHGNTSDSGSGGQGQSEPQPGQPAPATLPTGGVTAPPIAGQATAPSSSETHAAQSTGTPPPDGNQYFDAQGNLIVPPGTNPRELFSKNHLPGLIQAAEQRAQSLLGLGGKGLATRTEAELREIASLTADMLLAAFLKLNINDPNNNPENQNMLHQIATDMRQLEIDAAKKKAIEAEKQLQEADKYAQQAQVIGIVVTVIVIIISIIITIISFGSAAPAAVGASAAAITAAQTASQSAIQVALAAVKAFVSALVKGMVKFATDYAVAIIIAIIVSALLKGVAIGAEKTASDKSLEAQATQNNVKLHRMIAEMFQGMIDDQAAIIKMIMESKNDIVEAVLKMMKASQSSSQAVMAAGAAK